MQMLNEIRIVPDQAKRYAGIQFTPIVRVGKKESKNQNLLWEGIEEKSVQISELESSTVPTVTVTNTSDKEFFAFRGTIIRGGGQNRQVLHSFIMPAQNSLKVPVQCIQHGRWNPHHQKQFTSKAGDITSSTLRFYNKSQGETWTTVSQTESLGATMSFTQDYTVTRDFYVGSEEEAATATSSITSSSEADRKKREKARNRAQMILKDLEQPIPDQVGMYVTLIDPEAWAEGKTKILRCLELFASPEIYQKIHKDMLSSFAMDVAPLPENRPEMEIPPVDEKEFVQFIGEIQKGQWEESSCIGQEKRKEIRNSKELFGETISLGEEMIHMMCSSQKTQ